MIVMLGNADKGQSDELTAEGVWKHRQKEISEERVESKVETEIS